MRKLIVMIIEADKENDMLKAYIKYALRMLEIESIEIKDGMEI